MTISCRGVSTWLGTRAGQNVGRRGRRPYRYPERQLAVSVCQGTAIQREMSPALLIQRPVEDERPVLRGTLPKAGSVAVAARPMRNGAMYMVCAASARSSRSPGGTHRPGRTPRRPVSVSGCSSRGRPRSRAAACVEVEVGLEVAVRPAFEHAVSAVGESNVLARGGRRDVHRVAVDPRPGSGRLSVAVPVRNAFQISRRSSGLLERVGELLQVGAGSSRSLGPAPAESRGEAVVDPLKTRRAARSSG